MALTYFFLLPSVASFKPTSLVASSDTPYAALPTLDDDTTSDASPLLVDEEEDRVLETVERELEKVPALTTRQKFDLARPLFARFMLPLFFVYLAGARARKISLSFDNLQSLARSLFRRVHDQFGCRADSAVRGSEPTRLSRPRYHDQKLA